MPTYAYIYIYIYISNIYQPLEATGGRVRGRRAVAPERNGVYIYIYILLYYTYVCIYLYIHTYTYVYNTALRGIRLLGTTHVLVRIDQPSVRHCEDGHLTSRVFTEG